MKYKSEKLYVIGYTGKGQTAIYSKDSWTHNDNSGGLGKMTLWQAKKHLRVLMSDRVEVGVFKLVPVFKVKRRTPTSRSLKVV